MSIPLDSDHGSPRPGVISNLLIYQAIWLACVLGAARGFPSLGSFAALAAVVWHLSRVERPAEEFKLILLTGMIGGIWDSLLVDFGLIRYFSGSLAPWLAPVWIFSLWMAFATTFNVCLRWLHGRFRLASLFGLLGGPLAWWAGARLGALEWGNFPVTLAALGLGWAILMPGLIKMAMRFDGVLRMDNQKSRGD